MAKEISKKDAYKAMRTIIRYCKKHKMCCEECIFHKKSLINLCCISFLHTPEQWDIMTVKNRMEAEKCGKQ